MFLGDLKDFHKCHLIEFSTELNYLPSEMGSYFQEVIHYVLSQSARANCLNENNLF